MMQNLVFVGDKMPSLLAVSGDDGAGHREFYPEIRFDGRVDNCVKAENLLDTVWVFGVSPDADFGVHVMRQLGASKEEGIGLGAVAHDDLCKGASLDDQVEALPFEFFLNAKDLIEDAGFFRVGLLKGEGHDFHLGPFDFVINGKPTGGALHLDADLFMKGLLIRMAEPVANPFTNIIDDADKLNTIAFPFKPGASFISGVCRKEGPVGSDDFIGEKPETFGDLDQDVKDLIVKLFPQTLFKVGESGLTGDVLIADAGVKTKVLSHLPVMQRLHEGFHVGILFEMAEKIEKKKTYRIIGVPDQAVPMGDDGADKRKIHQGRNKAGKPSLDSSIVMDTDIPALVGVFG
jgi:hypothetical protein